MGEGREYVEDVFLCRLNLDDIFDNRVEAVFGKQDLAAGLAEKNLGAAADGVAVVDDHHLQSGNVHWICP